MVDNNMAAVGSFTIRRPHGTLVFGIHYPSEDSESRFPIFEFEPKSRAIAMVIGGRPRAFPLDFEVSGDHLLYMSVETDGLEPPTRIELFRFDGTTAVSLGTGFDGAAW
jgi:hypothetical protein